MADAIIKILCSRCRGSGVDNNGEDPVECAPCGGTGYRGVSFMDITAIMDKLDDIQDDVKKIKKKVDGM